MGTTVAEALDSLRGLGTPEELWREARDVDVLAMGRGARVNAHIHLPPNFSAFESVEQAVGLAADERIDALGVSNYYDYTVYALFVHLAQQRGIFPLFGLEIICMVDELRDRGVKINDPGNPGKMYVCGKGIGRFVEEGTEARRHEGTKQTIAMTPEAALLLGKIRHNDSQRMVAMVQRMDEVCRERGFDAALSTDDVIDMVVRRHGSPHETVHLQERHIAQAFQEALASKTSSADCIDTLEAILGAETKARDADDSVTMQNDVRSHLMKAGKPAFVEETFVTFEEAAKLILELGGIPCYPTLADGTSPVCAFEQTPAKLIDNIKSRGLHAAEFIPIRNTPQVLLEYATAMRQAGLVITAGTEHNTLDLIPIEPGCKGGDVPDEAKAIFWEGACVVAGHQFLTLHGEVGFVDGSGNPNAAFATPEERIKAVAGLGAAVIKRYQSRANGR